MARFTLKRFTGLETLRSVRPDRLVSLLGRYADYFGARGVDVVPADGDPPDYEGIAGVLLAPDLSTPPGLIDDLFFVDEMATHEGMESLLDAIAQLPAARRGELDTGPDPTPADVAVAVRLYAPEVIERRHAESSIASKRSYQYFSPANGNGTAIGVPDDGQIRKFEAVLDDTFEEMKYGRGTTVRVFDHPDEVCILVVRGDPCARVPSRRGKKSSSEYFRPEAYDVVRYDTTDGTLRVSAGSSRKLYSLYREKIGQYFFGAPGHFEASDFTLDPLRVDGENALVCSDIDGMESVVLREVHYFWGGAENEVEVRKADNIFEALKRRNRTIPDNARIVKAKFQVKFEDSRAPRMITVSSSNKASFVRDADSAAIEVWLEERGFAAKEAGDDV